MGNGKKVAAILAICAGIAGVTLGCMWLQKKLDEKDEEENAPEEECEGMKEVEKAEAELEEHDILESGPWEKPGEEVTMTTTKPKEIEFILQDDAGNITESGDTYEVIAMTWYDEDKVMIEDVSFSEIDDLEYVFAGEPWMDAFGMDPDDPDVACVRNNATHIDYVICRTHESYVV